METKLRTLIDYATGENWEMPLALYERYLQEAKTENSFHNPNTTHIQNWLASLDVDERQRIVKR